MARTARAASPLLLIACLAAAAATVAAPPDPAWVDGATAPDPAAVFAPRARAPRAGTGLPAWLRPPADAHKRAGTGAAGIGDGSGRPLSTDPPPDAAGLRLGRGIRDAQGAMDAMGRELLPLVGELRRGFDRALEPRPAE